MLTEPTHNMPAVACESEKDVQVACFDISWPVALICLALEQYQS